MEKVELFGCKRPCGNCPYRTDSPLQHWDKYEFERLLEKSKDWMGATYMCHKKNGSICVGWLMKQDEDNHPSIALRIELLKHKITREYLDSLNSPAPLYNSIEEMIEANYPELLKKDTHGKERKKEAELFSGSPEQETL